MGTQPFPSLVPTLATDCRFTSPQKQKHNTLHSVYGHSYH